MSNSAEFVRLLEIGRPPNIQKLFPNSHALLVSGKVIDRAMIAKGGAMTIAANARSTFVVRGALQAAQRANSAIIIEIARSEGGTNAYCPVSLWNMATVVDSICNQLGITIPVAIHADHFGIKKESDIDLARVEIASIFDAGITSIAVDASHMEDDKNLLANIELNACIPGWAGLETEVGEIKGTLGLSTVDDASFLIKGLNAHGICPDWIALNNGSVHGLEASGQGIQVELTADIHRALAPYGTSGAQHGTSGNSSERLRAICKKTATTKANVATALQMVSWGIEVNDDGNAISDASGRFVKIPGEGVSEEMWKQMVSYADDKGWKGGDYKKLNLPFENSLCSQEKEIRDRMCKRVEDFVYNMLVNVFSAEGTADLAKQAILEAGSYDLGSKVGRIEDPADWTKEKIVARAAELDSDKGPEGDFDD
ncbi:fructose/tagatose bisphosphate aldolase [Desulfocapsa sulfexigens DSM 10523]|uniref:Fructose/tagatose bisphosphate aldolase n=1 Tax=Desulfocapsa sulfexigens (strain DSM 10523 / SB164P1) TaxID=1167006 RepID=M1P6I0_DESSD|nr:class II fructose-bisphosphate aldolase [Desulfocapsa sulfexigens]AGF79048.1 fructose/tagatose bisphosphate aldolase [Desulfocapsa sulfexigens DSM 10523]